MFKLSITRLSNSNADTYTLYRQTHINVDEPKITDIPRLTAVQKCRSPSRIGQITSH